MFFSKKRQDLKIKLFDNWILFAPQEEAQIVRNDQNLISMPKIQSKQVTK